MCVKWGRPSKTKKLTADKPASAIENAVWNPDKLKKSKEIGEKIRQEDGIGNAVAFIEEMVTRA